MTLPSRGTAFEARQIARAARRAALATLDHEGGGPFASLVAAATAVDGAPVILISTLARHTRNIAGDARASLLFEAAPADGAEDALAGGRVTFTGRLAASDATGLRERFLARHPAGAGYAGFADFAFYRLDMDMVHYVGGFGRVRTMAGRDYLLDAGLAASFAGIEAEAVAHMNADHAETVRLYATALLGAADGAWRFAGCDPEGADLVRDGELRRLVFAGPVMTASGLRAELARLADEARVAARG